jgi:hypothetical protein
MNARRFIDRPRPATLDLFPLKVTLSQRRVAAVSAMTPQAGQPALLPISRRVIVA